MKDIEKDIEKRGYEPRVEYKFDTKSGKKIKRFPDEEEKVWVSRLISI